MAERSTLARPRNAASPRSSVAAFLDSLEDDQSDGTHATNVSLIPLISADNKADDGSHYNSLDMDVTDQEESHYLGEVAVDVHC